MKKDIPISVILIANNVYDRAFHNAEQKGLKRDEIEKRASAAARAVYAKARKR